MQRIDVGEIPLHSDKNNIPQLFNLSLVLSLRSTASQRIKDQRGTIWQPHTILCQGWTGNFSLIASHADLVLKTPLGWGNQRTKSSLSGWGIRFWGVRVIIVWIRGFRNLGHFQTPLSIMEATLALRDLPTLFTTLSPSLAYKGPIGCQLSHHKKVCATLPIWYLIRGWPNCLRPSSFRWTILVKCASWWTHG